MRDNFNLMYMISLLTKDYTINTTKLNKLLFFCDLSYFFKNDITISEDDYLKLEYGPVARNAKYYRDFLIKNNLLEETVIDEDFYKQRFYKSPDNIYFDNIELELENNKKGSVNVIKSVLDNLMSFAAWELSDVTHRYEPWKNASDKGVLDFELSKNDKELKNWLRSVNLV